MSRREFPAKIKAAAWKRANGICECGCNMPFGPHTGVEYHHRIPDALGGEPTIGNCQVLRSTCHSALTRGEDMPRIVKAKRIERKTANIRARKTAIPGGKLSRWKRKINGTVELRNGRN